MLDLLELAKRVAAEFERLGMAEHTARLRDFYARHRRMRLQGPPAQWQAEMVLEWAALLRLPPLHEVYPVYPHTSLCPGCRHPEAILRVQVSWPSGSLAWCDRCQLRWLTIRQSGP